MERNHFTERSGSLRKTSTERSRFTQSVSLLLFDSIQPQAKYRDMTSRQLLETWLNIHNSQVEEKSDSMWVW